MYLFLLLVTVTFGVARFLVPVEGAINQADVFKDLAHIWVGLLFGFAIAVLWVRRKAGYAELDSNIWWTLPIGLTVVEVVAFFVRKA